MEVCWSLMPGVFKVPIKQVPGAASRPASWANSRRAVASGGSTALSRVPATECQHDGVDRGAVLADQGHGAVVVHGYDGHGAGVADHEALKGRAVGIERDRGGPP